MVLSPRRSGDALPTRRAHPGDTNRQRLHLANPEICPNKPSHLSRTRGMRRIMAATMAAVEQAEDYALAADHHKFAEWIALQEALLGVEFVEEEKQHIRTQMLEPGITPVKITKARLLDMWDLMAKLVPTIESMKWTVVEAISGSHFITGDAPLLPGQPTPTKDGELSFHRRTAYITLPLSPSLMLLMAHVHQMPDYRSDYEANLVEQQNLFRVKAAEQHVFGDRNEPSIQSLVTEYENYRPPAPVPPNGPKKFVPAEVPRRS